MNNSRVIRRPAPRTSARTTKEPSFGRKATKWFASILVLLLMAFAAWAYLPEAPDPNVAKLEQLRDQMDGATDEQRRELWGQMRETYRNLPEAAREKMSDQRRQRSEEREQKFLNEFFALAPDEQIEKIDEQIKEEEQRRKEWAKRRAQQGDREKRDGGRGRGRGRGNRDSLERRKGYLDRSAPQTRAQRGEYRRMRDERRKALGVTASHRH